jgi:hypothetical protein
LTRTLNIKKKYVKTDFLENKKMGSEASIAIICLLFSLIPFCMMYFAIHELTHIPVRKLVDSCNVSRIEPQNFTCDGMYGRGPTLCKTQHQGFKIYVFVTNDTVFVLHPEFQATCDCCESGAAQCFPISTIHMPTVTNIWYAQPSMPFTACWVDDTIGVAYLESDEPHLDYAYVLLVISSCYFLGLICYGIWYVYEECDRSCVRTPRNIANMELAFISRQ